MPHYIFDYFNVRSLINSGVICPTCFNHMLGRSFAHTIFDTLINVISGEQLSYGYSLSHYGFMLAGNLFDQLITEIPQNEEYRFLREDLLYRFISLETFIINAERDWSDSNLAILGMQMINEELL